MLRFKKSVIPAIISIIMIASIYNSHEVIKATTNAITLCLQVIIPSLFPFMFLSMLLCNYWSGIRIPFLTPVCKVTGIPENTQSILLLAVIGGYPVGAQAISNAWKDKLLTKEQAHRLLGFCNNAGPSFIFGLIGSMFHSLTVPLALWVIHIGSAMVVGCLLPNRTNPKNALTNRGPENITKLLRQALQVTAVICGWVILFRILLMFLSQWVRKINPVTQTILFGFLELSNGCVVLPAIPIESIRFIVASGLISSGGFCIAMQTKAVVGNLGMGMYFPGKLLQTCLSVLFAAILAPILFCESFYILPAWLSLFFFLFISIMIKRKK